MEKSIHQDDIKFVKRQLEDMGYKVSDYQAELIIKEVYNDRKTLTNITALAEALFIVWALGI